MKKFLVFSALFFFSFLFLLKTNVLAFSCAITPPSIEEGTKNPTFKITSPNGDLASSQKYDVYIYGAQQYFDCPVRTSNCAFYQTNVSVTGGNIQISPSFSRGFSSGDTLTVAVYRAGTTDTANTCNKMTIKAIPAGSSGNGGSACTAKITSTTDAALPGSATGLTFTPNSDISLKVSIPGGKTDDQRRIRVRSNDSKGAVLIEGDCSKIDNGQILRDLGSFSSGSYYVEVNNGCNIGGIGEAMACYGTFDISPTGGGITGAGDTVGPAPICANSSNNGCLGVKTGLSPDPIGTDPASFAKSLFSIVLSIAGGIAVLLIIVSGYRLITSQGNPEKTQVAREQLTAAVIGLLFIIFSIFILQVIGHDILNIPGFS